MAIRFPSVLHAKQILRQLQLLTNQAATASVSRDVPKGYLVVYVGERSQKKRFIIPKLASTPVSFLSQPPFQELLSKAEEEFGYNNPMGGLTIPYREDIFINLTSGLNGS
ncbi:auxin-induced protein 15A-like [Citrus clementina]|uniref:auxin-induced protein 15A-like n=1 Tax=Citrus clementina TaxID=85681 RepID=UPI000CED37B5|nr:auxin-induced protein 15A-like [Citrus x clementina]